MESRHSARILQLVLVVIASIIFFAPLVESSSIRTGPKDFDWFIKEPPPTGPPDFKVRTTGYWIALEEDWPKGWYSGEDFTKYGPNWCHIPQSKRGFYEDVVCEGSGITNDGLLLSYCKSRTCIAKTREASKGTTIAKWRQSKSGRPPVRPKRTLAVNLKPGTPCYIPRYSRVYLKYPRPNHPHTGWYIAEDTGGAFGGKCKIDVFMGIGKQGPLGSPNPTVSKKDQSQWPEVWVFPGKKTDNLWDDNIVTYLQGKPTTGLAPGQGGVLASATAPKAGQVGYKPDHPYFSVPYSVNPSFSTRIPYDFEAYDAIPKHLSKLERCKDDIDCIVSNVSLIEKKDAEYNWIVKYGGNVISKDSNGNFELPAWELYCETPDQNAVNSLAEAIDVCARSKDNHCVCPHTLPVVTAEARTSWRTSTFGAVLSLTPVIGTLLGIASFADAGVSEEDKLKEKVIGVMKSGSSTRVFMRSGGKADPQVVPNAKFRKVDSGLGGSTPNELKYSVADSGKELVIYKDNKNNITLYPKSKTPTSTACELFNKPVKLCVVQNSTFFAYNSQDNRMGLQRLVLKFAYLFKSKISDVKNFEVKDAVLASNASLLVWDEVQGVDVEYYTLYYSEDIKDAGTLKDVAPSKLDTDKKEKLSQVKLSVSERQPTNILVASLSAPECVVDVTTCKRKYKVESKTQTAPLALEDRTLYYSSNEKRYYYFLTGLKNDLKHFFAITATDTEAEESPGFNMPDSTKHEDSKDDLSPALADITSVVIEESNVVFTINPVTKNIDGTDLDPASIDKYKIYCFADGVVSLDLTAKQALFPKKEDLTDGTIKLSRPVIDFNTDSCGTFSPGAQNARFLVTAVRKVGIKEVEFTGAVSENALAASLQIPLTQSVATTP
jgi:3D (Asp-Asp-Asp) domain-containing protein